MPWWWPGAIGDADMPKPRELERQYRAALNAYLKSDTEQNLEKAYGVGRKAIADGYGVLQVAAVFKKVLHNILTDLRAAKRTGEAIDLAMHFFTESLSPFEMTLRGFSENNDKLRESLQQLTNAETELRSQNEELSIARQRYREQFDFAPDGYLVTDPTGIIEEANVAASLLLQVEQSRLVGNSLATYLHLDGQNLFHAQLQQLQSGAIERVRDWQNTVKPEGGRPFPAALTVGVLRDSSGKPAGLRWLVRDITQFKRSEAERSELLVRERVARAEGDAARRLAFLAEASTLLSASLDSETTLQSVARLAVPFLADWCLVYIIEDDGSARRVAVAQADPAKEELARSLAAHSPPALPEWVTRVLSSGRSEIVPDVSIDLLESVASNEEHLKTIQKLGARCAMVVPLIARGRTLGAIALLSTQPQREFGDADRILAEDLARRCAYAVDNARLYSEVILQRDKAEKASRVKDEFLAILSHELRNPLVPILGWAKILKTRANGSDEVMSEGIRSLERNARNIQRLVDDCLELVRTSTRHIRLELERIDLNSVIAASIEAVVPLAREKGLKVEVELSADPLWIVGDRTRLEQVVVNLLTNAVKYTPAGAVEIRSERTSLQAQVCVRDSGIGIAPDFIEKVFEPFRQATTAWLTSDSGLGIGLSIAREIVNLHSGKIWAESRGLRRGSDFFVSLPLSVAITSPILESAPPRDAHAVARHLRLLLVEDSSDVRFLIQQELEWAGHKVYPAPDGQVALEIAKREIPDMIISDIKMPNLDGYQLMQQVRAIPELARIPAIAMTGFGMARDVEQARSAGYSAHLVKPVDIDEMDRLIQRLASGT
jgi:PAS domain S-box-containing protein